MLLVIAKDDRKLRIEVGYELEGVLTDATAKRIISDVIVPQFKSGNFSAGVVVGVTRIISVVDGEALPPPAAAPRSRLSNLPFNPEWLIAGCFVLFSVINHGLRAVLGKLGAAGVMAVVPGFILWLVISSLAVSSIAAVVAFVVSLLAGGARATFGGGYGGSGGGGSWSSGGGGGGFGGGGGRSGGGASGSWRDEHQTNTAPSAATALAGTPRVFTNSDAPH